jgi:hypothetical protein
VNPASTNHTTPSTRDRLADSWHQTREHVVEWWLELPPFWRSERTQIGIALVVALLLLVAFGQVVAGGVERAARRDASVKQSHSLQAICATERQPDQRELCLLTRPGGTPVQVATTAR